MTNDQLDMFGGDTGDSDAGESIDSSRSTDATEVHDRHVDVGTFRFDDKLARHLVEQGIYRGRLRLATDLVAMEPAIDDATSRALFMAIAISLEAQARGSTFVPLPGRNDYFFRRLRDLIPGELTSRPTWSPEQLVQDVEELVDRAELALLGEAGDFKPLVVDDGRLYHQRMLLHEQRLVDAVARRIEHPDTTHDSDKLDAALDNLRRHQPPGRDGEPIRLSPDQKYALLTALHRPMTLITGGPGTGKTSIIVSILRLLVRLGISPGSIALAAPTGKAANRMAESIYAQLDRLGVPTDEDLDLSTGLEPPRTIHRLLGYSPRRDDFSHHPDNPLAHRFVIVDEASMIDLFLMERLLHAVSPTAQLVLLGDADQLPSVDTGAVLRDLIPDVVSTDAPWRRLIERDLPDHSGSAPTADVAVRLETSFRMREDDPAGREILTFARSIRDYDDGGAIEVPNRLNLPMTDGGDADVTSDFEGVGIIPAPEQGSLIDEFCDWWFSEVVLDGRRQTWKRRFNHAHRRDDRGRWTDEADERIRQLLAHYRRARVLTLTRVFSTGSRHINDRFHRQVARLGDDRLSQDYDFHPGEPVMMLRNDYDRNLFNGDQGIVVWARTPDNESTGSVTPVAVFERPDGLIAYPLAELADDLEHAFAMTVHKAQGSEFERIALILPSEPMTLLNRELLYTGLTRASRGVLLVGDEDLVETGAANHDERFSAVGERLQQRVDGPTAG